MTLHHHETNWRVEYETDPIRIRDPVAEALAVLDPGDPFVITYADVVKIAGHSCPTAAGAFRLTRDALAELYPDDLPVRGDVEVLVPGSKADASYGVTSRIVSYVTGAAEEDGFAGLAGGHGGRQGLLSFDAFAVERPEPTLRFRRTDTGETVEVVYHTDRIPEGGPALQSLPKLIDGTAGAEERAAFRDAWHARIRAVLADEDIVTARSLSA